MTKNEPQDILLGISFDFVGYDDDDKAFVNVELQRFLDTVSLPLDMLKVDEFYFNQAVGTGDVYLYDLSEKEFLAFDLYRGFDDQCDIISVGLRIGPKLMADGVKAMRALYDSAHFMVSYTQKWQIPELAELANKSVYPRCIGNYKQEIHVNSKRFFKNA